jgi:hypothetical protein
MQRREPRVAYAIGIGVGVALVVLLAVVLPVGSALESINLDPREPAPLFENITVSSISLNITYQNSSNKWLGAAVQDECEMITCPVEFETTSHGGIGSLIIYVFSASKEPISSYDVTQLKWNPSYVAPSGGFTSPGPLAGCTAIGVGYSECVIPLSVPPPGGPFRLTVYISA